MKEIDPQRQPVAELRNSIVAVARRLKQSTRERSETWTGLLVLGAIDRADGQATPSQIAFELELRSSNFAQLLGELQERGLVMKQPDRADRRKVRLSLTPAGRTLVAQTRAQRDEWLLQAMHECLSVQEQAQLMQAAELLQRLALARQGRNGS